MEEIKVGDYFRTKNGYINKIRYLIEEFDCSEIKYSSNIIDLIEVGDYVNGEKVIDISERGLYIGYEKNVYDEYSRIFIDKDDIKSIVTKERFENIEYRLED